MAMVGNALRYGAVAQIFHWLTAILVMWTWLIAGSWGRGGEGSPVMALHQTLGFTIFVLVLARLAWRLFDTVPATPPMPTIMALAGKATHWLLFALLIAVPLSAIVCSWLEGNAITVYGQALGPYLARSRDLGDEILEIHELLATAIIWVAGLHAAAAIFHHVFLRDRVLRQMLPVG